MTALSETAVVIWVLILLDDQVVVVDVVPSSMPDAEDTAASISLIAAPRFDFATVFSPDRSAALPLISVRRALASVATRTARLLTLVDSDIR